MDQLYRIISYHTLLYRYKTTANQHNRFTVTLIRYIVVIESLWSRYDNGGAFVCVLDCICVSITSSMVSMWCHTDDRYGVLSDYIVDTNKSECVRFLFHK